MTTENTTRANIITRRTYSRPLNEEGTVFETWSQTVERVIEHQRWLWERALTHNEYSEVPLRFIKEDNVDIEWTKLSYIQELELQDLRSLLLAKEAAVSGRTLWLGGTDIAKRREASMFNCSFTNVETVYDLVDVFWLLLQGCGVGFRPVTGSLTGFRRYIPNFKIIRSKGLTTKGREENVEIWDVETRTWTIRIGDSAEAWAKSIGKLMAGKYPAETLVLDFSEVRKAGVRLKNYGWISQGDAGLSVAYTKVFELLNARADSLLSEIDVLDVVNLLGTVLSTRRSAQIAVLDDFNGSVYEFSEAKSGMWDNGKSHRSQSNNSIIFWEKPKKKEIRAWFEKINQGGNGEPGLINGKAMRGRAPWAVGLNPCAEILLPNKGFCNLVSLPIDKFANDTLGLHKAAKIVARANYRQTVVDFRDGILQESWHLNNEHLRLCGVSLMGIAARPDMQEYDYRRLERTATSAANSMAKELGLPYPKNVTSIKPEGTQSKCYDSTEGMHDPLGKYIFNNVAFSKYDPLLDVLRDGNYRVFNHPYDDSATLVTFPVKYDNVKFSVVDGKEVNVATAIQQLERYKMLMQAYCQQNVSSTISYSIDETDDIVKWLHNNWDNYVAVSFLFRNDPTKTAADLGYPYLPQEVVTKEEYDAYVLRLKPIDIDAANSSEELLEDGCAGGVCPVR